MTMTRKQLENGDGCSRERPVKAFSYDDGETWHTCELNESIRGETTDVLTIPAGGTLHDGV